MDQYEEVGTFKSIICKQTYLFKNHDGQGRLHEKGEWSTLLISIGCAESFYT